MQMAVVFIPSGIMPPKGGGGSRAGVPLRRSLGQGKYCVNDLISGPLKLVLYPVGASETVCQ